MEKKIGKPVVNQTWVQTSKAAHEAWASLIGREPRAAQLLHLMVRHMDESGALVASREGLAQLMGGVSVATIKRATAVLRSEAWIDTIQIGGKGGALAYVVNARVAWGQRRDQMGRMALFNARVLAIEDEQGAPLEGPELRRVPMLFPGEVALPGGAGETPPSQPGLDGVEPPSLVTDVQGRQWQVDDSGRLKFLGEAPKRLAKRQKLEGQVLIDWDGTGET